MFRNMIFVIICGSELFNKFNSECDQFDMARPLWLIYCRANQMVIVQRNWFIRFIGTLVPIS